MVCQSPLTLMFSTLMFAWRNISYPSPWLLAYHYGQTSSTLGLSNFGLGLYLDGYRSGISISADSPSDETLNRGPLALLLRQQYEFPFGINIVQFSFFFFFNFQFYQPNIYKKMFNFLTYKMLMIKWTRFWFHLLKIAWFSSRPPEQYVNLTYTSIYSNVPLEFNTYQRILKKILRWNVLWVGHKVIYSQIVSFILSIVCQTWNICPSFPSSVSYKIYKNAMAINFIIHEQKE